MPFLVFIPVMYSLSEITGGGINFKNKTHWHFYISLIVLILNGIGVYLLVPKYGARGAAFSTAIAYIALFYLRTVVSNFYFKQNLDMKQTSLSILLLLLVAYVNTFFSISLKLTFVNLLALIVISIIYFKDIRFFYYSFFKSRR
jgi:O-antigen/teichoic acid export membrane protein